MKKMGKLDFFGIKNFHSAKAPVKTVKCQAPDWEKIFVSHVPDKGVLSSMYRQLSKLSSKEPDRPIRKQ